MSDDLTPDELVNATTAVAGASPSLPGTVVPVPTGPGPIGRFVVLETLGSGGMGVVYAAYDPTLDRRIAVKLLRPALDGAHGAGERERMLREARALARLDHPAILTVHDAGVIDGRVFIATELAAGGTLRQWQEQAPRGRGELLAAYLTAGRGLAAAHDAGLVHRDFKPDNVLRTGDGRIRVADFGLVSTVPVAETEPAAEPETDTGSETDPGSRLTVTGTVLGTPRYMAPEQHRGDPAGPAADQFAYCVALWHALTGDWPFPGGDRAEISDAIDRGPPVPPAALPGWLAAALGRGLARDPAARWPSMAPLLAALADDPQARRRRRLRVALALTAVAGLIAAIVVLAGRAHTRAAATCDGGTDHLATVWSPARAAGVRDAFAATGLPYAPAIAARVTAALDARATAWREAHRSSCRATRVSGEQSEALLDRRMSCLDRRLGELDALVGAFAAVAPADRRLVDGAIDAVAALPSLDACADVARLGEQTPPPADPAARTRVEALFRRIAAPAPGRPMTHRPAVLAAAHATVSALVPEVEALHHPPLDEALALRLAELGPTEAAEGHLRDALRAAAAAHDDAGAAYAWMRLVRLLGVAQHRHADADVARVAAEAADTRAGRAPADDPDLLDAFSEVANDRGDLVAARELAAAAFAAAERTMAADDPRRGRFLTDLATAERFAGHQDAALVLQRRALELHTRVLGAEHPATLYDEVLVITLLDQMARHDEALPLALDLAPRADRLLGTDHPYAGGAHMVLGETLGAVGRGDESLAQFQAALAVMERALGPEHTETVNARSQVATALIDLGRFDEAAVLLRAVLASHEHAYGPEHPRVAQALLDLGDALKFGGHYDEARRLLDRAVKVADATFGPHHRMTFGMVASRAQVELFSDHPRDAMPWLERAMALADETLGPGHPRALIVRFDLALARWDLGQKAEARALARDVAPKLRAAGSQGAGFAATVDDWLAKHP